MSVQFSFLSLQRRLAKIANPDRFSSRDRGVLGYSFQLAITAPRINLIGYGTATAQSWWLNRMSLYIRQEIKTISGVLTLQQFEICLSFQPDLSLDKSFRVEFMGNFQERLHFVVMALMFFCHTWNFTPQGVVWQSIKVPKIFSNKILHVH